MKMPALDFLQAPSLRLPWVMLACGALALWVMHDIWDQTRLHNEGLQTRIGEAQQQSRHQVAPIADPAVQATAKRIDQIKEELQIPWSRLFQSLEQAANRHVALRSIKASQRAGRIVLEVEARDKDGMLAYLKALAKQPDLQDVVLENHKQLDDNPDQPVTFSISAKWSRS